MVKKIIRAFIIVYLIFMLALIASWSVWHIKDNGKLIPEPLAKFIINFASFPSNVYHTLSPTSVPNSIFDGRQITDTTSQDGIRLFTDSSNLSSSNLLISTFLSSSEIEFKLIRIPDGKLIKNWEVPTIEEGSFLQKENTRIEHIIH